MSSDFDALFQEHDREMQSDAGRERTVDDVDAERRAQWARYVDALTVALQSVADAATSHGHQATVTLLSNRSVEFEIRFKEHPDLPASCSFTGLFPPGSETAIYVDSNGPGKFDDPRDPVRRPLSRFSTDDACNYVSAVIRSASKLLP